MKRNKIFKCIFLILLLLLFIFALVISENRWPAWIILGISVITFTYFINKKVLKKTMLSFVLLGLTVLNLISYECTIQISLVGAFMSKVMVPIVAPSVAGEMLKNREDSLLANQALENVPWENPDYILEKRNNNGVKFETITPKTTNSQKIILEIHGGGFVLGLNNSYRDLAVKLSKLSKGSKIVLANYTTAEVAPYPAALNDCIATYQWILDQGTPSEDIIMIGDSAGGNLALALGLYIRDQNLPLPAGIITISAFANMKCNSDSYYRNADTCILGPYFGNGRLDPEEFFYTQGCSDLLESPYLSPVYGDYSGFPKLLMQVGSREIVLDDARIIVANAKNAGVDATVSVYHGMWHVFQLMGFKFPEVTDAWKEIDTFIKDCWY